LPHCDHNYPTRNKIQATGCVSLLFTRHETIITRVCARARTHTHTHPLRSPTAQTSHPAQQAGAAAYVRKEREREKLLSVTSGNTDFTKTTSNYFI